MAQALRVWCGVPTALLQPAEKPAQLQALGQAWADECRRLLLVAAPAGAMAKFASVVGPAVRTPVAINRRRLERTVLRKPHQYTVEQLSLLIAPVTTSTSPGCAGS